MSINERDPKLPHGTDKCRCMTCGEYFNSTFAFDAHRIFTSKEAVQAKDYARRACLSGEAMRARGMAISATGHWVTAPRPQVEASA